MIYIMMARYVHGYSGYHQQTAIISDYFYLAILRIKTLLVLKHIKLELETLLSRLHQLFF